MTTPKHLRVLAWIYLIAQIFFLGTGGLVRLSSSGLGCPTWPKCTPDSLISTPEMGIHGFIEFGNRALTLVLAIVALIVYIKSIQISPKRSDLRTLSLLAFLMLPAQAIIGGFSVLSGLNPYIVALHFIASLFLVALCTVFVIRIYAHEGPYIRHVKGSIAGLAHTASFLLFLTIVFGILTTGSGPHAGDASAPRNNLNPEVIQSIHSLPAIALALTLLVLTFFSLRDKIQLLRIPTLALLASITLQMVIGIVQAKTGLPPFLVITHMILSGIVTALMTLVIMRCKAPALQIPNHAHSEDELSAQHHESRQVLNQGI